MISDNGYVKYNCTKQIGEIKFFHPKGNSLPAHLLSQLADAVRTASNDHECRVIILRSTGEKTFCGGASFDELLEIHDEESGKAFFMGFANVINAMRLSSKVIICRIQGKTIGGGVGLAAASDFSVAVKTASVRLSELSLGIGPFVVGPAIERKVGNSALTTLALDANSWYDAEWAHQRGLFNQLAEDASDLDHRIELLAADLSKANPDSLKQLKEIFWQGTEEWSSMLEKRASISGKLILSDYTRNYIAQFRKK